MKTRRLGVVLVHIMLGRMRPTLSLAPLVLLGGCPGTNAMADSGAPDLAIGPDLAQRPFCTDGVDGGPAATFANVQRIFTANCAIGIGCHDPTTSTDPVSMTMDLRAGMAYSAIVNVPATEKCGIRVVPASPEASYLYRKISEAMPCMSGCSPPPRTCNQMPWGEIPIPLPECAQEVIRQWITAGAPPE